MTPSRTKILGLTFFMALAMSSPLRADDDPIMNGGGLLGTTPAPAAPSCTLPPYVQSDVDAQISSLQGQVAGLKESVAELQQLQATDETAFEARLAKEQAEIDKLQSVAAASSAHSVAAVSSAHGVAPASSASSASNPSKPSRTSGLAGAVGKVENPGTSSTASTSPSSAATAPGATTPGKTNPGSTSTASSGTSPATTPTSTTGSTPTSTAAKPATTAAAAQQTPWWQTFLTSLLQGLSTGIKNYAQAKAGVIGTNANVASAQLGAQYPTYAPQINSQIQTAVGQSLATPIAGPVGAPIIIGPPVQPIPRYQVLRRAVLLPRVTDATGTHPVINMELGTNDN